MPKIEMKNTIEKIEIDDLTLRRYQKNYAVLLKDAVDSSLTHLRTFMDWANGEPLPLQHKIDKIAKWEKEFSENKNYTYAIFRGDKLLGNCGLYNRSEGSVLEIGYWTRADEINKGVATKATRALLKIAFDHIKIEKLEIHLYDNNKASGRIPEKLGFKRMPNYTYEEKDDSAWYVLNAIEFFKEENNY